MKRLEQIGLPIWLVLTIFVYLGLQVFVSFAFATPPSSVVRILPDSHLSPGVANPKLTKQVICAKHFSTRPYRHVTVEEKWNVYRRYGLNQCAKRGADCGKEYEIDHLIPLEAGGSNSMENLWPQPRFTKQWNAATKDRLENELHRLICAGVIDQSEGQKAIASNWIDMYKVYCGTSGTSCPAYHRRRN